MWLIVTTTCMTDVSLWIIIFGSLMCLAPLLRLPGSASYDSFDDGSAKNITNSLLTSRFYRESLSAGLFIVVIPTADLFVELSQNLYVLCNAKNLEDRVISKVIRLTNFERILFITGVIIRSAAILVPVHDKILQLVFDCTNNSSTILMTCPVMVFFGRCTTTWTPSLTLFTISLTVVSNILETTSFFFEPETTMCTNLLTSSQILVILAVIMVVSLTSLCLYKYLRIKVGPHLRKLCIAGDDQSIISSNPRESAKASSPEKSHTVIDELYEIYVPGAHMFLAVTVALTYVMSTILRNAYPSLTPTIGGYENTCILICAVSVLIVEYRIRGNEITRGLIREKDCLSLLLDSKKSYVRYISHELRTPLNTTFLGMRLLSKDFDMSDDPRDRLRFETLTDMSLSCTAALDILNDLLCFEKLESGILDLHKQEVHVMPFLHDCVNMFAVQAKECDVTMTVYTDFDRTECASHHNPDDSEMGSSSRAYGESEMSFLTLEDADVVMIDKFKMDQVIRNLISNALKFTPRGGRISIKVSFVPNSPSIQSSSTCSKNSSGHDKRGLMRQESYFSKSMNSLYAKYAFRPSQRKIFPDSSSGGAGEWGNMDVEATGGRSDSARYEMSNLDSNDGSNVSTISGKLVIIVTDSGAGISADNQKRLFKEIVQFQPEILQAGGGSGLGLWITRGIVDLHDGKISVFSAGEGKGTRDINVITLTTRHSGTDLKVFYVGCSFTVEIPMQRVSTEIRLSDESLPRELDLMPFILAQRPRVASVDKEEIITIHHVDHSALSAQTVESSLLLLTDLKMTILVVDDSRLNRKMLIRCLQIDGHTCEEAEDGYGAIEKVKEKVAQSPGGRVYDAILMDFVMPNMDGPTATKEIRAMGYTAPIFGVTGNGLTSDIDHFMSCGVNEVLLKPLNVADLYRSLKQPHY